MLLLFSSEEIGRRKNVEQSSKPRKEIKETLEGKSLTATANFA